MNLNEAKSIVAKAIQAHTRIVRLMSEATPDPYFQERRDSWDAEDYRDATEGRCGFPWEKESDEDESEWNDDISRESHFDIAQIAFAIVESLAGSWRDTTGSEYAEFLRECGLNHAWVAQYIPEGTPSDEICLY